jgi:hypothetical protein
MNINIFNHTEVLTITCNTLGNFILNALVQGNGYYYGYYIFSHMLLLANSIMLRREWLVVTFPLSIKAQ